MNEPWLSVEPLGPKGRLFALAGESDLTGDRLRRALESTFAEGVRSVVVDCTRLAFLDTRTIDALLAARSHLREQLVVVAPPGELRRVLEVAGLDTVLRICPTREDALAALGLEVDGAGPQVT